MEVENGKSMRGSQIEKRQKRRNGLRRGQCLSGYYIVVDVIAHCLIVDVVFIPEPNLCPLVRSLDNSSTGTR